LLEEDKLLVEFNITTAAFIDGSSSLYFDPTFLNLTTRIPKQLEETTATAIMLESAKLAYQSMTYSLLFSFLANMIVSGILSQVLGMINSL